MTDDTLVTGDGDTPEAGDNRLYPPGASGGDLDWSQPLYPGHSGHSGASWSGDTSDQPLSDLMPDIAMAGECHCPFLSYFNNFL